MCDDSHRTRANTPLPRMIPSHLREKQQQSK